MLVGYTPASAQTTLAPVVKGNGALSTLAAFQVQHCSTCLTTSPTENSLSESALAKLKGRGSPTDGRRARGRAPRSRARARRGCVPGHALRVRPTPMRIAHRGWPQGRTGRRSTAPPSTSLATRACYTPARRAWPGRQPPPQPYEVTDCRASRRPRRVNRRRLGFKCPRARRESQPHSPCLAPVLRTLAACYQVGRASI